MTRIIFVQILFAFLLLNKNASAQSPESNFQVKTDSLNLFDKTRNRPVPVMLYFPIADKKNQKQKLVIFSHGYYQNMPSGNQKYSFLTENLAANGFF
ncbi:MAG: hypothetical protein ABIN24_01330, partial [Dyadobacter sp.]